MSLLAKVRSGKIKRPYFILVFGPEGVGKSTFASNAPDTIWIDMEAGSDELDVTRLPGFEPRDNPTIDRVYEAIDELEKTSHSYKTLVIDSLTKLEPLAQKKIIEKAAKKDKTLESIEDFGYAGGQKRTVEEWQTLISKLASLRNKMNVILIGHSAKKRFDNPQTNTVYERYEIAVDERASAVLKSSVSAVLFATEEILTKKDGRKVRAYGEGKRVIFTERRPSWEAKNRYGLPFELALDWQAFDEAAIAGNPDSPQSIRQRMDAILQTEFNDQDPEDKVTIAKVRKSMEDAGEDAKRLSYLENLLKTRIGEEEGESSNA